MSFVLRHPLLPLFTGATSHIAGPKEASKAGRALHNQRPSPARTGYLSLIIDKFLQQQVLERLAEDLLQAESLRPGSEMHPERSHPERNVSRVRFTMSVQAASTLLNSLVLHWDDWLKPISTAKRNGL